MTTTMIALVAVLTLAGAACGDDDGAAEPDADDTTTQPTRAGGEEGSTQLTATLAGTAEGDPDGEGDATVTFDAEVGEVCFEVAVSGIDAPTGMHIHEGGEGEAGPVVIPLVPPEQGDGSVDDCVTVEDAPLGQITASPAGYYLNVHTGPFPDGAVRGQLEG